MSGWIERMCAMFRNASHFPSEGSLGGLISGLSGALRQVGDAAASVLGGRGVRMDEDGQGPFEAAVQAAAGSGNDTDAMMARALEAFGEIDAADQASRGFPTCPVSRAVWRWDGRS